MPDFFMQFNPATDVVYGTGMWIEIYIYNYHKTVPNQRIYHLDPTQSIAAHKLYGMNVINLYNTPIRSQSFTVTKQGQVAKPVMQPVDPALSGEEIAAITNYTQNLGASHRYGPSVLEGPVLGGRTESTMKKYVPVGTLRPAPPYNSRTRGNLEFDLYDVAIRRSCKFGIFYFTRVKTGRLHYALDGLDIQAIVRKARFQNATTHKEKVPICTSEICYIFRHWNALRDGRVQFYLAFNPCQPPWEDDTWQTIRPAWAEYASKRLEKWRGRIPEPMRLSGLLNRYDTARAQYDGNLTTATAVIQAFHELPANLVNYPDDDHPQ